MFKNYKVEIFACLNFPHCFPGGCTLSRKTIRRCSLGMGTGVFLLAASRTETKKGRDSCSKVSGLLSKWYNLCLLIKFLICLNSFLSKIYTLFFSRVTRVDNHDSPCDQNG